MIKLIKNLLVVLLFFNLSIACSQTTNNINTYLSNYSKFTPAEKEYILANSKEFTSLLNKVIDDWKADKDLFILVDKNHYLDKNYVPTDLVSLNEVIHPSHLNKAGLSLRQCTIDNLQSLIKQATTDGINLIIGSSYRSYRQQVDTFNHWVKQNGETAARRISAVAGTSQHQLGLVVDFVPIDQIFANTKDFKWLDANAYKYGFSLSFPNGFEKETGYDYESWHYRYIGTNACKLQKKFFGNLQYKLIEFLDANKHELLK